MPEKAYRTMSQKTEADEIIKKRFQEYGKRAKAVLEKKYGPNPYKFLNNRSQESRKKLKDALV